MLWIFNICIINSLLCLEGYLNILKEYYTEQFKNQTHSNLLTFSWVTINNILESSNMKIHLEFSNRIEHQNYNWKQDQPLINFYRRYLINIINLYGHNFVHHHHIYIFYVSKKTGHLEDILTSPTSYLKWKHYSQTMINNKQLKLQHNYHIYAEVSFV